MEKDEEKEMWKDQQKHLLIEPSLNREEVLCDDSLSVTAQNFTFLTTHC